MFLKPLFLAFSLIFVGQAYAKQTPKAQKARRQPITLQKLSRIIEGQCTFPEYNAFAKAFYEKGTLAGLGMTKVEGGNPFLEEYLLKKPIQVFHRETKRLCFTSSGAMAILEGVDAEALAKELDLTERYRSPVKVMFAKVIEDELLEFEESSLKMRKLIRLNVSTVTTHPGCVLAGCEYRLETQEEPLGLDR